MDYTGMSTRKGYHFSLQVYRIPISGWRYVKGYLFRERYVKGVPFQGIVCEKVPIFQYLVCKRVRDPNLKNTMFVLSNTVIHG